MSSKELIIEIFTAVVAAILCVFSPDSVSMIFAIIMSIMIFFGVFVGVRAAILMATGFTVGMKRIRDCENMDILDNQRWLQIRKVEHMFNNRILDGL